jgi:hypothetical protein
MLGPALGAEQGALLSPALVAELGPELALAAGVALFRRFEPN